TGVDDRRGECDHACRLSIDIGIGINIDTGLDIGMIWTLHALGELASLAADWDRLNLETTASPLLSTAFILPLVTHFPVPRIVLARGSIGGDTCAMLLLVPVGRGVWQTFQPSQAPLGACVGRTDLDWPAALSALLPRLPAMATAIGITQQDPDLQVRPSDSTVVRTMDYIRTARITLDGDFETYWQARGKNLRQNLKKQRNKLEKDGIVTRLQVTTAPEEVARAVADYGTLESAGWKSQAGTAVHAGNAQGAFYTEMLENFCRTGRGRIYRYWYNQQLAAMDLCIEGGDSIVILKTTYDEQVAGTTSPALLMRQEAVALLFGERRLARIEFYGKVLEWHTRWSDEVRTMFHVTVYRWSILRTLQEWLRRRPGATGPDPDSNLNPDPNSSPDLAVTAENHP
ncbi:MAG: GNAT family N-acetyltransferase, partial [Janthinobacterium lividum]